MPALTTQLIKFPFCGWYRTAITTSFNLTKAKNVFVHRKGCITSQRKMIWCCMRLSPLPESQRMTMKSQKLLLSWGWYSCRKTVPPDREECCLSWAQLLESHRRHFMPRWFTLRSTLSQSGRRLQQKLWQSLSRLWTARGLQFIATML